MANQSAAATVADSGAGLLSPHELQPNNKPSTTSSEGKTEATRHRASTPAPISRVTRLADATTSVSNAGPHSATSAAEAAVNQLEHDLAHAALASEDDVGDGVPWAQVHTEQDRAEAWKRRVDRLGRGQSSTLVDGGTAVAPRREDDSIRHDLPAPSANGGAGAGAGAASSWFADWWPWKQTASGANTSPSYHLPVMRVNQLGAGELDDQLSVMLLFQFNRIFRFFNFPFTTVFKPEIELILQALIFRFSVFVDVPSPGQQLQNLRYRNESHPVLSKGAGNAPPPQVYALTNTQKLMYAVLVIGCRYGWTRLQSYMLAKGWAGMERSSWKNRFFRLCEAMDKLYRAASLVNFLVFLVDGKYPSLVARLLRMRLVYIHSRVGRQVNFEFMDQQLMWHGFSEFLLFIVPLINVTWIRQRIRRLFGTDPRSNDTDVSCPVCHTFPLTTPYEAKPCHHAYCYYCLHASMLSEHATGGFRCRRCQQNVDSLEACSPERVVELGRLGAAAAAASAHRDNSGQSQER